MRIDGVQGTVEINEQEDAAVIQRARNEPNFREGFLIETPTSRNTIEEDIEENNKNIKFLICVEEDIVGWFLY